MKMHKEAQTYNSDTRMY
jgi:hypothetical protein